MNELGNISFEKFTDDVTFVNVGEEHIGEISIDEDGEAQIDFDACWLCRSELEIIVEKMREMEVQE